MQIPTEIQIEYLVVCYQAGREILRKGMNRVGRRKPSLRTCIQNLSQLHITLQKESTSTQTTILQSIVLNQSEI